MRDTTSYDPSYLRPQSLNLGLTFFLRYRTVTAVEM